MLYAVYVCFVGALILFNHIILKSLLYKVITQTYDNTDIYLY